MDFFPMKNTVPGKYLRFQLPSEMKKIVDIDKYEPCEDLDWDEYSRKLITAREKMKEWLPQIGGEGTYEKCNLSTFNLYGLNPNKIYKVLLLINKEDGYKGTVFEINPDNINKVITQKLEVIKKVIDY